MTTATTAAPTSFSSLPLSYITLPHKPASKLVYLFHHLTPPSPSAPAILLAYINGLMLPMSAWAPSIDLLTSSLAKIAGTNAGISILAYDRPGQGLTPKPSPSTTSPDQNITETHDILDSVSDLHHLLTHILSSNFPSPSTHSPPKILLVAHSIGAPLARLYCQHYPGAISGLVLIASNIANSDIVSIFPDPDSSTFRPADLPEGVSVDDLKKVRERMKMTFHPAVPNAEGLDRSKLPLLLPEPDEPKLLGPNGSGPYVTVINHGNAAFCEEGLKMHGTPVALNDKYFNPAWWAYSEALVRLTGKGRGTGPLEAVGAGHFVQRDRPDVVAEEVERLLWRLADAC